MFVAAGLVVLCAFVSPYRADRDALREVMAPGDFREIYVQASLEACRARDPKGLYRKAAAGQITDLTGVAAPYEAPLSPDVTVDTERLSVADSLTSILRFLEQHGYIAERRQA
jgi:adenylylsulfate kinase